jgi:hypothetical protein
MTELPKFLSLVLLAATAGTLPAAAQTPFDMANQQAQANAIIQQQNLGTQLNSLQLQQNMTLDRLREQQLFTPQPLYGAQSVFQQPLAAGNPAFQPQPPGIPPLEAPVAKTVPPAAASNANDSPATNTRPPRSAPPPVPTAQ